MGFCVNECIYMCVTTFSSVKLVLSWCEVSRLERSSSVLLTECIRVCVKEEDYFFSMFLRLQHTYELMQQLAEYAIARMFDKETYNAQHPLRDPLHITQRYFTLLIGRFNCTIIISTALYANL